MNQRVALVPASYVIFRRDNSVLLQLRQNTGYMDGHWATAAAGHVEAGESAEAAAIREAYEELGVRIAAEHLVPLTAMHRFKPQGSPLEQRVDFFFSADLWAGEPRIMEGDKAADLQWFSLNALPEVIVPHERYVLECLLTGMAPIVNIDMGTPVTP
ncbi:DNA mismatch repair protein MutT [Arthrobacter psychrolactophilus]|uniref:DNA mismatch repair protein MutT n=1 Tax=Arthrobacter psychrolactophilus TaxID=92442 RepID=A0A2V5JDB4_9MICC|nr:NUDIX domain-containing protein [Arthrobacter psychrolactophilus]PYI37167.1 DNA mismatch repair protein MutT [Arthrobacter psychrolactophilus]